MQFKVPQFIDVEDKILDLYVPDNFVSIGGGYAFYFTKLCPRCSYIIIMLPVIALSLFDFL